MDNITIPGELLDGPIWNNGKPFSEAQAYIQFISWCESMGGDTHFIHGNMITLKANEFIMSQRKIAESINWTQSAVNRFLKKLVKLNQCCINNESKMTRISLNIVAVPQESESILNQDVNQQPNQPTTLYDTSFGGGTNSDISNNYNIINNNNITNKPNTTNNNNIFKKPLKKSDTGDNSNKVVVKGKASVSKNKPFTTKPKDLQMVIDYFKEKHPDYAHQAEDFYEYYESVGWKRGKTPIKVWRMAVGNWVRSEFNQNKGQGGQVKKSSWLDSYRKGTAGDYIVFCHNEKCHHYGNSLFCPTPVHIKQGCKCSQRFHPTRPTKKITKPKEEIANASEEENLISYEEFRKSQRPKESTARGRTTEGDSQHISTLLDSLFQPRQRRGQS